MTKNPSNNTQTFIILGWICTGISLLLIPILFGAGGVIFGYLVRSNGKVQHGTIMMIAAIACGLFGVVLGMATADIKFIPSDNGNLGQSVYIKKAGRVVCFFT
ncbi:MULTISPECIES: hypothetical protein [Bacillus]|uniref:hypothetical protein n=1 Tax=Bacillus TaxID=1386 RepID=UPI00069AB867|nr:MULTISPECIES: hypothetical protein [Bacillus]MDU0070108.1 hypothetical protein [Bacillus sp. IG6]MED8017781.1 hypothetical protein [Bacillus glycinifermentans]WKB76164.1 hypothetical protein QYM22_17400 [Bacillus glycinifermentans]SCA87219.1 hypothetical protein BGLY_3396 [Bacillus glycinifermentans]